MCAFCKIAAAFILGNPRKAALARPKALVRTILRIQKGLGRELASEGLPPEASPMGNASSVPNDVLAWAASFAHEDRLRCTPKDLPPDYLRQAMVSRDDRSTNPWSKAIP